MPRDVPLGNGSLLVAYDRNGLISDLYYPGVGMENHLHGYPCRVGLWIDGVFQWLTDPGWERTLDYEADTLVARLFFRHPGLGIELVFRDAVDFHEALWVREATVTDLAGRPREARLFFHHDLSISGTDIGDTAGYKPDEKALLHYKGQRYFLLNAQSRDTVGLDQFATGVKRVRGLKGTWADAEDGRLSGNPIAQGSVDSVFAAHLTVPAGGMAIAYCWIAAGCDWKAVRRINALVVKRGPGGFLKRTADYWRLWLDKEALNFDGLPQPVVRLYRRSLLITRTNVDDNGAITAANDTDILYFNRDTYSCVWPRDGALITHAMSLAGYHVPARRFFELCARLITDEGYFLHKYNPDGSLGSSWHPWPAAGGGRLPIQEDETGLVLWALWAHFARQRDIEFIKPLYRPLIKNAAEFLCRYRDPVTGLPLPSYDLWEERLGVHTYTVCAVIAGLRAAARFTGAFGEMEHAGRYEAAAEAYREALLHHLYDSERGRFLRGITWDREGRKQADPALDASLYALFAFRVFPGRDERVAATMQAVRDGLWCRTPIGGLARYEHDTYQASQPPSAAVPGNPWIIASLWYVRYLMARATTQQELDEALPTLLWCTQRALPSGVLPEQIDPASGTAVSVSPLTWSHAEFITAVQEYLNRREELSKCPSCEHPAILKYRSNVLFQNRAD